MSFNGQVLTHTPELPVTSITYVDFDNSMTASTIQSIIDNTPRYAYSIQFRFAAGTYTLDRRLVFAGFCGHLVEIRGVNDGSSAYKTQSVVLDFQGQDDGGILLKGCSGQSIVRWLRIKIKSVSGTYALAIDNVTGSYVLLNFFEGQNNTTSGSYGLVTDWGKTYSYRNVFGKLWAALVAQKMGFNGSNDDYAEAGAGNLPAYSLHANTAGYCTSLAAYPDYGTAATFQSTCGVVDANGSRQSL